jgi:3-methylfumaryl-CoA hydratase
MEQDLSNWLGRTETRFDQLDAARTHALSAALAEPPAAAGMPLPALHHWLYFWDVRSPEGLGLDGHPAKGGFLPPIALPRRMWAGGRVRFLRPLMVGDAVRKVSTILDIQPKSGRTGELVFVTLRHELSGSDGLAIVEEQDLVYREAASPGPAAQLTEIGDAPTAAWHQEVEPDPVLLFRYSALTMNGHRIHYDREYAVGVEAYPALVVQGPLQATLLAGLARRHLGGALSEFVFRGMAPAVDGMTIHACGEPEPDGARLWVQQGPTHTMTATARAG